MQTPPNHKTFVGLLRAIAATGVQPHTPLQERKRIVLSNQLFLIALGMVLGFIPFGVSTHVSLLEASIHLTEALFLLGGFYLNHLGLYRTARTTGLAVSNTITFFWVLALGKQLYAELFFFPVAAAPLLFIGPGQRKSLYFLSSLSVALFFAAHELKDYTTPIFVLEPEVARFTGYSTAFFSFALLLSILYYFQRGTVKAESELIEEQKKSERLLLNILPEPIALRLKKGERLIADRFERATVIFADLVNFTPMSGQMSADALVNMLNHVFSGFDVLCEKHGLEKIKTIGDSYMAAAGLPEPDENQLESAASMALEMLEMIRLISTSQNLKLELRVGIHTGPVVAGVIGERKFIYDLWGDTVNIASRMESHGLPGHIQVTQEIYEKLQNNFEFVSRGSIEIKGKGALATYFLLGRKSDVNRENPAVV